MARQPAEVVDWEGVDEDIQSVPAEYREYRFYPLKHVVELFNSRDRLGDTAKVGRSTWIQLALGAWASALVCTRSSATGRCCWHGRQVFVCAKHDAATSACHA